MFPKINPTQTQAWQLLQEHFEEMSACRLNDLFENDPQRFQKYSIELENLLFDYSKNLISEQTLECLFQLAEETKLQEGIKALFSGEQINETENRAVLHTALRDFSGQAIYVDGENVQPLIAANREKMKSFCEGIHSGKITGSSGKKIKYIVNIGIGGSDLGPYMVTEALKPFAIEDIHTYFVSNVDAADILEVLKDINAEETLFLISSKSFGTQETMLNAATAKSWFLRQQGIKEADIQQHFLAITQNKEAAVKFGIQEEHIFEIWDWVCGRFSLWSSIGLSIALSIGYDRFEDLLRGAEAADVHFKETPFERNIPVIMGMISIWYINFWKAKSKVMLSYNQYLHQFANHFQQGFMESNGKSVDRNGQEVDYTTGVVIWGGAGTNCQHSFFQLLHQGTEMIPADFIAAVHAEKELLEHQELLLSNFLAQTEALMKGKSLEKVEKEMEAKNSSEEEIKKLGNHKMFAGNKPSNSILLKKLNPYNLGTLIALYEHEIFVKGVIWNIFSFDQWGVELGKQLSGKILPALQDEETFLRSHNSTSGLINYYKSQRNK